MKRILSVLGIIFLLLIATAGATFVYLRGSKSSLDESSKAFVDSSIPLIASTWSRQNLLNRASSELKQSIELKPAEFQAFLSMLSKLGALKQYRGSAGGANVFFDSARGRVVTAQYFAEATMTRGEAYFSLKLIQHDGEWQFQSFDVHSPAFCHANVEVNCVK